jgi:hypothetical protein
MPTGQMRVILSVVREESRNGRSPEQGETALESKSMVVIYSPFEMGRSLSRIPTERVVRP